MDVQLFWQAVEQRDAAFRGRFVYAVRSTGIYCEPGCRSRRPSRENVLFFETAEEARRAGFRACRRCGATREAAPWVEEVRRFIDGRLDEPLRLAALAARFHVTQWQLLRAFERHLGVTPRQYIEARRRASFKAGLRAGGEIAPTMYDAGFQSSRAVYEKASEWMGMTPGTYRRGGAGLEIRFAIAETSFGHMLLAATGRGVCALRFGDSPEGLEAELRAEFARATISADSGLVAWIGAIREALISRGAMPDLPLDIRATVFEARVWELLRTIERGKTLSYSEVAAALGNPKASRAVAQACAHNPVALLIPCHRVVRSDGELAGYRWGVNRKRALLEAERAEA